jgi:hypothetical protein
MGLTPASVDRRAFTIVEPIGIVAAISAFNLPLNLIVDQVVPAIAVGCPVIVKPAPATPLSCIDFVGPLHEAGLPPDWCQTFLPETNELAEALATGQALIPPRQLQRGREADDASADDDRTHGDALLSAFRPSASRAGASARGAGPGAS